MHSVVVHLSSAQPAVGNQQGFVALGFVVYTGFGSVRVCLSLQCFVVHVLTPVGCSSRLYTPE